MRNLAVLVVDDEKNIRHTLRICIESLGADVTEASSAPAALEAIRRTRFDVVFLDLRLGTDSGLDLIAEGLAENPNAAIIVMTAYATIETAVEAVRRGAWDYLPKPFTPAEIRHLLERIRVQRSTSVRLADLEERLQAEADAAGASEALGLGAAEALSFTHQVLQESLRLYPPGWLITRRAIEADELGGFAIAPRTDVFISPYMLHRHPEFWSEAEAFRPERFAAADADERHKFAYIPFAVGPRHCIGENIAMFEMLVHMHTMVRRFRLSRATNEPIEFEAQINLRPRSNLMMTVETR